jgi:hypothetical protein
MGEFSEKTPVINTGAENGGEEEATPIAPLCRFCPDFFTFLKFQV